MLVITRKKDESILIGDNVEIVVVKIDDGSVKLAINAPRDIKILRKELYKEVIEENKKSISIDSTILKDIKNK
ncbi:MULTISPECIES: carbon storage regulator CsrA [Clostridium]|uniref:carbon storage regulator CsrA n=1 Tax=Clostridium TaxID=1485 RepID=UPI00069E26CB|nr:MULTISPECIES: carbon storage regulator CsrA [Clostridium]KOF55888.1 carbon storage regulator [Clostridium sp. DMHC 10]MCD2345265.1 carbon storage regulator CsrA [Clostridium guangxiense]